MLRLDEESMTYDQHLFEKCKYILLILTILISLDYTLIPPHEWYRKGYEKLR